MFYENIVRCTRLVHCLNRVAENIRMQSPLVNTVITCGKKIFVKSPLRDRLFGEGLPNVPIPPEPIVTRWGTWWDATLYYSDHFFKSRIWIIRSFRYAPITSVDVERSFSKYKNTLTDRRTGFVSENLGKHLIISQFRNVQDDT